MKKIIQIILLSVSLIAVYSNASAQDTSKQQSRKESLEREIAILDSQIKSNSTKSNNALNELKIIQKKMSLRNSLIIESENDIKAIESSIKLKQSRIDSLQYRMDTMSYYYSKLVKSAYKNRDAKVWYMYILASENLSQGFRRLAFLRNLSSEMNNQGKKIISAKNELQLEKQQLDEMMLSAKALREQRVKELNELKQEEKRSQSLISQLKKENSKYQSQINAKKKEVTALNKEISKIIADAMNASSKKSTSSKNSTSSKTSAPIDYTLGKEFSSNKGKLPWPAEGPVVETFGVHYHPVYKQLKLPNSDGISIAVADGTQVKAVFDGVVSNIIVQPGYNKCVLVQHGDFFTFYCKLGSVSVKAGDKVKTGQVLGVVEPIGGEIQVHFQLWSSKGPQNPVPWLRPK